MTQPPIAARRPHTREHHGDVFVDHYEWLRDKNNPDTIAHLERENAYADAQTAHLGELRDTLYDEIKSRTKEADMSVPVRRGRWWYYARTVTGQQYAVHCRVPLGDLDDWTPPELTEGPLAGEQILLDQNAEAEGHDYFQLGAMSVSDDHAWLAWSVDTTGDERYTLRIRRISDGAVLPDVLEGIGAGATWSPDGRFVFYTRVDEAWRPHEVWRHEVGSKEPDIRVFAEPDEKFFVGVGRTASDKHIVIGLGSKITSEVWTLDASDPTGDFRVVWPRVEGVEYAAEHVIIDGVDHLVLLHNRQHANFEIALAPWSEPERWSTLVAGSDDVRIDDVDVTARHVLVSYRSNALPAVGIMDLSAGPGPLVPIEFDAPLTSAAIGGVAEFDPRYVRLAVGSFVEPARLYDLDPASGERILRKQGEVLGEFNPAAYEQHRVWAEADDGTQVPISLICRVGTPRDGSAPALLYGYGSYEASIDPGFSIPRLSLLDRGFVFAVAHVRGGGEMGRHWYENGKTLTKRNTFTDFIACARQLVSQGWTSADRLVAEGGSAGGLLMGAVANEAPDAFAGIVADVPFVDPLTSILDPTLPLTVIEWDEWGNPLHDPEVYAYMKRYSPYENIAATDYPAILATTSLNDTRVLYVEPAKWVARLREVTTGQAPILLKTEMTAGHGGVSGRYAAWRQRSWELAWIIDVATGGSTGKPRIT